MEQKKLTYRRGNPMINKHMRHLSALRIRKSKTKTIRKQFTLIRLAGVKLYNTKCGQKSAKETDNTAESINCYNCSETNS